MNMVVHTALLEVLEEKGKARIAFAITPEDWSQIKEAYVYLLHKEVDVSGVEKVVDAIKSRFQNINIPGVSEIDGKDLKRLLMFLEIEIGMVGSAIKVDKYVFSIVAAVGAVITHAYNQ